MKTKILGLLAVGLLAGPTAANAVRIVYTLDTLTNVNDGSSTLNGWIAVDDDGDGKVFASEITAWQFTAAGVPGFSISSGDVGASITCLGANGCFSVAAGALSFDFPSLELDDPYFQATGSSSAFVAFVNAVKDGGTVLWRGADDGLARPSGNVIARAPTAEVPEPASLALFGLGLAGLGLSRRRKTN